MSGRLYITLNRAREWQRCLLSGLKISGESVISSGKTESVLISGSADSGERDFLWKSLTADMELSEGLISRIYAYASDSVICNIGGVPMNIDDYLSDKSIPYEEKIEKLKPLFGLIGTGTADCPINLHGRYIWIKLEFTSPEERMIKINKIKLLLKSESMTDYLPEVYRIEDGENGFLSRFMSIFDNIFFDMDERIDNLGGTFDYRTAKGGMLKTLARWVNIEDSYYPSDEELRRKISRAPAEYGKIGTKRGISEWIENEYGAKPNIIEYYSVRKTVYEGKDRVCYRRLFGEDSHRFFILLPEKAFKDARQANIFMERLKNHIPAGTRAEVTVMKNSVILGNHTYLGVNSVISGYTELGADTGAAMTHDLILGGSGIE